MKSAPSFISLTVLILFTLSACGAKREIEKEKAEAQSVVDAYFEAISGQDFDGALALYAPSFFRKKSRSESMQVLANFVNILGDVQTYQLIKWKGDKKAKGADAGFYWRLQYRVEYSNRVTIETINLTKPLTGEYKITNHSINQEE